MTSTEAILLSQEKKRTLDSHVKYLFPKLFPVFIKLIVYLLNLNFLTQLVGFGNSVLSLKKLKNCILVTFTQIK